ncbi:hypothetical protein Asp14428_73530 [Actinoplanes sp. NBRC 14428]|nr:hypothetical protein Asp14428_73530 [Actinoplanes sp. NBRC 14428]
MYGLGDEVANPQVVRAAWVELGRQLAARRKAAKLSQQELANRTTYSRSSIANIEIGLQHVDRSFWEKADQLLEAGGELVRDYDAAEALQRHHQRPAAAVSISRRISGRIEESPVVGASFIDPARMSLQPTAWGSAEQANSSAEQGGSAAGLDHYLWAPPGRALPGVTIPAQLHRAVRDDQVVTQVPAAYAQHPFLQRPGRALVIGQLDGPDADAYVLDSRHARRRLRGAGDNARLLIPPAYRLDELTFAMLWAVANFDEALLADDAVIASTLADNAGYALMTKSAASRDMATDANPVGRMWLGSQFCADHVRRHSPTLTDTPVFWTREQRGEEAATWLLFAHKHEYLRDTSNHSQASSDPIVRVFCIPHDAVTGSPLGERALLLLAVALMESYGIHTAVTDAPELAGTAGFVTDRHRRAITATWVGADGIWYVDATDDRSTLRAYGEAAGYATINSVTAASTAHARLANLAGYLGLDSQWLITRCRELAEWGTAGVAQPRSRLLSLDGLDRACQFVAECGRRGD